MTLVRERRAGQTCEAFDISLTGCIHVRSDPRGIGGNDRKELADEGNVLSGIHSTSWLTLNGSVVKLTGAEDGEDEKSMSRNRDNR